MAWAPPGLPCPLRAMVGHDLGSGPVSVGWTDPGEGVGGMARKEQPELGPGDMVSVPQGEGQRLAAWVGLWSLHMDTWRPEVGRRAGGSRGLPLPALAQGRCRGLLCARQGLGRAEAWWWAMSGRPT